MAKQRNKQQTTQSPRIVNRKARYEYHILESLEVGIKLMGSEVKSVRAGQVSLAEGYARVERDMQLWLYQVDIAPYAQAGPLGHEPKRRRKLLAHKHQINKLLGETSAKGTTLVPLTMYFERGMAKIELGVVRGKQAHDKRQSLKDKDAGKEIRKGMTRKTI